MYEPAIAVLSLLLCACAGEPDAAPTDGPVSDAGEPGDPGSALDAGAGEPDTEPGVDPGDAGTSGDLPEPDSGPCDPWCGEDECGDDDCSGSCGLCDDGNVCTNDTCVEGECEFNPYDRECDDGDACTLDDVCLNGACQALGEQCDDDNPCTAGMCTEGKCTFEVAAGTCDDGDPPLATSRR